ncbi:MAG: ubiquinol-cytochrome c reductase iron-sulfur subunit [Bacteroidetes bacterium]|nr:ubiquinol-cytochrome c reductase iron-sulfur subunit [Bacteroidota bacterium]
MEEEKPKVYSRRKFFHRLSISVIGLAGLAAVPFIISSIIPRKVIENRRIRIGKPDDFPINQMTFLPEPRLYILRDHTGIAAMSAICTHLGCVVDKDPSGFLCPCHGSSFTVNGIVLTGPAPRSLPWYRVNMMPDGTLIANLDKKVSPDTRFVV